LIYEVIYYLATLFRIMKIVSYNVNGIRSAISKNWLGWLVQQHADVVCLQEIKAEQDQLDLSGIEAAGYPYYYFHSAEKKGYSGVAIFSKIKPDHVEVGSGMPQYDREGRVLRADFKDFSVMSVYHPSGSSGEERQAFKMIWLSDFRRYISELRKSKPKLVLCGDYNICHQAIDIHDPKGNAKSSGFLPEEREWMTQFLSDGFIDSFRHLNKEPHQYTWWTFRAGARGKNKGWRIDYCMVSENLADKIEDAAIYPDGVHSDHCGISVTLTP
jgi:exodeoxyribonuclease-3